MLNEFFNILVRELTITIESFVGIAPKIAILNFSPIEENIKVDSFVNIDIDSNKGKIKFLIPIKNASLITDLLLAGDGIEKDTISKEDLEFIEDIISNVLEGVAIDLETQGFKFNFKVVNSSYNKLNYIKNFALKLNLKFEIQNKVYNWIVLFDNKFFSKKIETKDSENSLLLKKIKIKIGSKTLEWKDVIDLDINSIIVLNENVSQPIELFMDNKKIALAKLVVIDGKYALKIEKKLF